ncbi:MAG: helicase-exonuclease AddAB subunit AddA [Lachnospiraceae bacterium]|nr:helicase-exonuclease AddAB subunit AddA [Lachnospiraceae bacterium]
MGAFEYTRDQLEVIESRGSNLLVSAAAGSGKTAVLVERIIRRVTDPVAPVDVDRILVLTFTNAAAAQMKEKIYNTIEEKRAEKPSDVNLQKQAALVHNAMITTIHGFCLSVLKNHFNEAGLTADFRVADEGECRLLRQDALSEVLEKKYEENDPKFIKMAESLAGGKTDRALEELVLKLYEFSVSSPEPDVWFDHCLKSYEDFSDEEKALSDIPVLTEYFRDIRERLTEVSEGFQRLLPLTDTVTGLDIYRPTIEADLELMEELAQISNPGELMGKLKDVSFIRFGKNGRKGDPKPSEEDKKHLQQLRDVLKDRVKKLQEKARAFDPVESRKQVVSCLPVVRELISLTKEFTACYREKKRDAGIIDYSDMEQLAIRVFLENDGAAAEEYRELYEEVYVDEYQDSNLVQETILTSVSRGDNLFMVGDVKQSIYGFRLARPDIFLKKYNTYKEGNFGKRIDLNRNFRSRTEVLDAVNEVFAAVMKRENTGIEYDQSARLVRGSKTYTEKSKAHQTELVLVKKEDTSINEKELEAEVISQRIKSLLLEEEVIDSETGKTRGVMYKDIVILLRTAKDWSDTFAGVLKKNEIPVQITSKTGYFAAYEVALILDFLKVIDNPRQDIPLASVLLGFFGKMTDGELALIRGRNQNGSLYDVVQNAAETERKAADFLSLLNYYRGKTGYTGVYELLREIIDDGYGRYVAALENGRQRLANLNMLLQKAEDYAKTSYKGLFQFVRYIDMLKKYEVDYGENTAFADDNAVRIMTIHNSKGLEFPVCFVAGLGKQYNFSDQRAAVILDADHGIGMDLVDLSRRTRAHTILKDALSKKGLKELGAEELRLLYVAMTRAKEKLILTGHVKDFDKALEGPLGLAEVSSHLDLLLYANRIEPLQNVLIRFCKPEELVKEGVEAELGRNEAYLRLLEISEGKADYLREMEAQGEISEMIAELKEKLKFRYEAREDDETLEKFSVTELKQRHLAKLLQEDREAGVEPSELFGPPQKREKYIPTFIRGVQARTISGNIHGSAVHRLFELWDYSRKVTPESIAEFKAEEVNLGRIEQELAESVTTEELLNFLGSPLAERMQAAGQTGQLYREQPFMIRLDGQLIQGIIDAFFIEEGEIVIVDYKTDRVNESTELVKRYELQLEYYARALQRLLGIPVKERIIYSTVLNQSILV